MTDPTYEKILMRACRTIHQHCKLTPMVKAAGVLRSHLDANRASPPRRTVRIPNFELVISDARADFSKPGSAAVVIGGCITVDDAGMIRSQVISATVVVKFNPPVLPDSPIPFECGLEGGNVIRRFHFDLDCANEDDKPTIHFQYGGKHQSRFMPRAWRQAKYRLVPKISRPRIPAMPMDLLMVIDLFAREFKSSECGSFLRSGEWQSVILESQELFQGQYLEHVNRMRTKANTPEKRHFHRIACMMQPRIRYR